MNSNRNQRLAEVARIAVRIEAETGVPAAMLVAQWAIESRWGTKPTGNSNYFGIKRAKRHAKYCAVTTREVVDGKDEMQVCEFADYDSLEASCQDYAWLITHGIAYREAWRTYQQDCNLSDLVVAVARRYATDPQYGRLAVSIAGQANVDAVIQAAKVANA
jgi:flagellar protein FlgJ